MLDFIAGLVISLIRWFKDEDIYYIPYKSNMLGEHKKEFKEDKRR